jgi:hypothetical protein
MMKAATDFARIDIELPQSTGSLRRLSKNTPDPYVLRLLTIVLLAFAISRCSFAVIAAVSRCYFSGLQCRNPRVSAAEIDSSRCFFQQEQRSSTDHNAWVLINWRVLRESRLRPCRPGAS